MKHVVILSNSFYPIMGPTSAVVDKYIDVLSKDFKFHIITKTYAINFEPSRDHDIYYITNFIHKLNCQCLDNIKRSKYELISKLILFFIRLSAVIKTQYSFPTARKWEINAYYNQLLHLRELFDISAVIAVSDNFVIQLAMLKFKEVFPNTKWISFILDPYTNYYIYYRYKLFKKLWKRANLKKEIEIYNTSDYCMFSVEMYNYVSKTFKIDKSKMFPIHFVLNKHLSGNAKTKNNDVCQLVYAGGFYREVRNPDYMLLTMSKIHDIHLDLYVSIGECEDIINKYVSKTDKIVRYEFVGREEYIDMIRNRYDILVNVGNVSSLQAPSKMLELLSTGKPIINFTFSRDSQYEMIENYPLGINIMHGEKGAEDKIRSFCNEMKGKIMKFDEIQKLFPQNDLYNQADLLKKLLES